MKNLLYIFAIFLFAIISCRSKKEMTLQVTHINNIKEFKGNALLYSLPKNKIHLKVEVKKNIYRKGPFCEFAEKLLGIKNTIRQDKTTFEITNISISTSYSVDTTQIYQIEAENTNSPFQLILSPEGLIQSAGFFSNEMIENQNFLTQNFVKNKDSVEKKPKIDTSFITVPFLKRYDLQYPTQEKAAEIAENIFLLRKDRKDRLDVDNQKTNVEGKALEVIISEYQFIEEKYLSLFVGFVFSETQTFRFEFLPDENRPITQKTLFRFSPSQGILSSQDVKGEPITIEIAKSSNTAKFDEYNDKAERWQRNNKKKKPKFNGLFYRIPDKSTVRLIKGKEILIQQECLISQLGTILNLPASIWKNENCVVDFYLELGNIKSIRKK